MPFLQFITGSRDQQFEELNPAASLVVGSGAEAHIKVSDPDIQPKHCNVYPAQGSYWLQDLGTGRTIVRMKSLSNTTEGLKAGDVFIVGTTFVKFWQEKPAGGGGGGGGGGGADPAALEAAKRELARVQAEFDSFKSTAGEGEEKTKALEAEVVEARQKLEEVTEQLTEKDERISALEQEKADAESKASLLEGDVAAAKGEVEQAQRDAEQKVREAEEAATKAGEDIQAALEASQAALEGFKAEVEGEGRDRLAAAQELQDLDKAVEALGLPSALGAALRVAVDAEIDREVLRRCAGPVVPLRGLKVLGGDRDLEGQIQVIRRRGEQVEAARELGLAELESSELERLLEMARS